MVLRRRHHLDQDGAAGELVADVVATDHGLFAVGTRSGSPAQALWNEAVSTSCMAPLFLVGDGLWR